MRKTASTELLLDLVCAPTRPLSGRSGDLDDAAWRDLVERAAQHRLEPILHDRLGDDPMVPERLRAAWRDAYRFWALKAAAAAADLRETFDLLNGGGFAPLALKGAFLAWRAYPSPALRPLRDIDILVPETSVTQAFALLRDGGWIASSATGEAGGKHLTPLTARRGTTIELHHRLWERDGELDHHSPAADHGAMRDGATIIDGIAYPRPDDMLAHLIVHAVYSHRLDCGPLLLWDVYWLARTQAIDWPRLRARAIRERWDHGLDLTIALCRRYLGPDAIACPPDAAMTVADDLVDAAADLLVQNLDTRRSAGFAAAAMVRGIGAATRRVTHGASARLAEGGQGKARAERVGAWAGGRLRRTIGELIDPAVRGQARDLSRLSRWLGA